MDKQEYIRPRNVNLAFRVTEDERAMIERRMAQAKMKNMRAFIVKMVDEGQIVRLELDSVKEMVRLLSNATSNINQIARRANETGSIYTADLDELRGRYDGLWDQTKLILQQLSEIQRPKADFRRKSKQTAERA